jgi:FkbM family methyltransferase
MGVERPAQVGAVSVVGRLANAAAGLLPDRALAAIVRRIYPRVEPELRRIADLTAGGGTVLDVGAWYGPWSYRLRRHAERTVAVEPNPRLAGVLRATLPGVEVVEAALGERAESVRLWIPTDGRGREGIASLTQAGAHSTTVRMVTLDSLGVCDLRFVKLDVEGHELAALRGGEQTILRDRPTLLVELEARIQPVAPVLDLLAEWGYAASVLVGDGWRDLAGFDLAGHQRDNEAALYQGLARRAVRPKPRYVNLVRFRPR